MDTDDEELIAEMARETEEEAMHALVAEMVRATKEEAAAQALLADAARETKQEAVPAIRRSPISTGHSQSSQSLP